MIRQHSPDCLVGEPSNTREREGVLARTPFSDSDLQECAYGVFLWSRFFYNGTGRETLDAAAEDHSRVEFLMQLQRAFIYGSKGPKPFW